MIKIAVLGYKDFVDKVADITSTIRDVKIFIYNSFGSESLDYARELEGKDIDVIITGQANYAYLKDKVNIPIVILKVGFLDIINALNIAKKYNPSSIAIAFSSFNNFDFNIDLLGELINTPIHKLTFLSADELEDKIIKINKLGIDIIVGPTLAVSLAEKHGMKGILIYSIEDTFLRSIEKAIEITRINEDLEKRVRSLNIILNSTSEGIIFVDENGKVALVNNTASTILKLNNGNIEGRKIDEIIKGINYKDSMVNKCDDSNHIYKTANNTHVAVGIKPLKVKKKAMGAILTLQDTNKIEKLDTIVREEMKYSGFTARYTFEDIKGKSKNILKIINIAKVYAKNDATVLIQGESGTGKELFAQSIHNYAQRNKYPFVAINCASLPENLLESELFGYEPGAFTGADRKGKRGLFEIAHKGTIFLDEIDSVPMGLQGKLLRVIEEREIIHIGGKSIIPIDVRIIASTNRDLRKAIQEGKFRKDLYYRINVLRITIPPLRERKECLPEIIEGLIKEMDSMIYEKMEEISLSVIMRRLNEYDFPGNVRELKNILSRFILLLDKDRINEKTYINDLIGFCLDEESELDNTEYCKENYAETDGVVKLQESLQEKERKMLVKALKKYGDKKSTARELGIGRTTLYRKMKKLGLDDWIE